MFSSLRWGTVQEWRQLYWSYADVVSRGQMAGERLIMAERFGLIGYKPVHWGQPLWGQNDDQFRDQTIRLPAGKPPPLIITLRKCFPFCISQSSFTFIPFCFSQPRHFPLSFSRISPSSHSLLRVASHASGCWIIDGMLSWWDFSCCGLVCWSRFVLLSLSVVTLCPCVNVCALI